MLDEMNGPPCWIVFSESWLVAVDAHTSCPLSCSALLWLFPARPDWLFDRSPGSGSDTVTPVTTQSCILNSLSSDHWTRRSRHQTSVCSVALGNNPGCLCCERDCLCWVVFKTRRTERMNREAEANTRRCRQSGLCFESSFIVWHRGWCCSTCWFRANQSGSLYSWVHLLTGDTLREWDVFFFLPRWLIWDSIYKYIPSLFCWNCLVS